MTVCLCALVLASVSAMSADLTTTADFTRRGMREANPLARPFVQASSAHGELALGVLNGALYLAADHAPEPWRSGVLGVSFAVHAWLAAVWNPRHTGSPTPTILFPVIGVTW